jgi:hypothetical protein
VSEDGAPGRTNAMQRGMRLGTRVWHLQFPSFNHARVKEPAVMNYESVWYDSASVVTSFFPPFSSRRNFIDVSELVLKIFDKTSFMVHRNDKMFIILLLSFLFFSHI